MKTGMYIKNGNITVNYNETLSVSDFIEIPTSTSKIETNVGLLTNIIDPISFFDISGNFLSASQSNNVESIPNLAKFIRLGSFDTSPKTINITFIKNNRIETLINTIKKDDWSNKKWLLIGDSITEENFRASKHYWNFIQDLTNIQLNNIAKSGSGYYMRHNETTPSSIYDYIQRKDITNCDLITIFAGINDVVWTRNPIIGNITDNVQNNSILGFVNGTIDYIESIYNKYAPLGIISPLPACVNLEAFSDAKNPNQYPLITDCLMEELVTKLKQLCDMRGYPFLDLFHNSGFQPQNESCRNEYFKAGNNYTADGLHPNANGHELIYRKIMSFIEIILN